MRKVIAAINMTMDAVVDHTAGIPDEEVHQHYAELINSGGVVLYGRTTFELMKFWKTLVEKPSGEKVMDDFAVAMDKIPKLVFSKTLKTTDWNTATLADKELEKQVLELKAQAGKDILIGSRSLIVQLINLNLIDEFQLCIHPLIEGKGMPLFDNIKDKTIFKLSKTKLFGSGVIILYYQPKR